MDSTPRHEIRAWTPDLAGVVEVLHASFTDHAYPPHCHDTWTILLVDAGSVAYELADRSRHADASLVTILPPFVAHDGRSARSGAGFRKRVLYVDRDLLGDDLVGRAVDQSMHRDRALRSAVARLHDSLARPADDLEQESRLHLVVERLHRRLTSTPRRRRPPSSEAAEALKAHLDVDPFRPLTLSNAAASLHWSTTHLIRSFTAQYGLPPHRYLISRRLDEARRQLLAGTRATDVAANVGFHDQAHLNRHFTRHLAITPARYRRTAGHR